MLPGSRAAAAATAARVHRQSQPRTPPLPAQPPAHLARRTAARRLKARATGGRLCASQTLTAAAVAAEAVRRGASLWKATERAAKTTLRLERPQFCLLPFAFSLFFFSSFLSFFCLISQRQRRLHVRWAKGAGLHAVGRETTETVVNLCVCNFVLMWRACLAFAWHVLPRSSRLSFR